MDLIAGPIAPTPAYAIGSKIDDPLAMYLFDLYTVSGNLAGICGISIPCGFSREGLPIGLQLQRRLSRRNACCRPRICSSRRRSGTSGGRRCNRDWEMTEGNAVIEPRMRPFSWLGWHQYWAVLES